PTGVIMVIAVSDIWLETLTIACLSTWVCDTAALLGGHRLGRHKLDEEISPNKTVEGSVCGAVSSVGVGLLIYYLGICCVDAPFIGGQYTQLPLWLCILTSFAAASMGQIGDLAESMIKRMIGIKDFSNLIPGHGGMLDRADSLLFSIPAAYFCLRLAGL
nr:phosphatidate cytidylyltransferase [Oscillospiraceae bacterium]